jgi:4-hydroxybenzoyl-CoA thioesterase/acyl-CoA thioester hydrolase
MPVFRTTRRVEFRDTDAAGIMHFSAFFTMMEEVEHELLRSLGFSVVMRDTAGETVSWPRVSAQCDFRGTASFEEILDVSVTISRLGEKSVTYAFLVSRGAECIAEGRLTVVCCKIQSHSPPVSIPIPADIRAALERYVEVP